MTSTTPQIAPHSATKPRSHWPQTLGYYAAFVALGLIGSLLGLTLPNLAAHTSVRLDQISILFSGRALGYPLGLCLGDNYTTAGQATRSWPDFLGWFS